MSELSLKEIQAITELAKVLQSFIPANAHPYSKPKVDFGTVAKDVGIGKLWAGGGKLPAIQTLLEATLKTRRDKFCPLMIRITKEALKYRNKKGNPITQEDMNLLNQLIVGVGFKIPELVDPNFISSLPKEKSNSSEEKKDEIVSSKISPEYAFQRLQPTSIIGFDGQDLYIIFEKCLPLADVIRLKVRKLVESGEFHYPVLKLIPEILNAKNNNMFGKNK
jgi:hypothetical protein